MKPGSLCRLFNRETTVAMVVVVLILTWTLWPAYVASAASSRAHYTALGDSLAFGLFAFPGRGYVPLYAMSLQNASGLPVTLFPLGVPGWTSGDLVAALEGNGIFQFFVFASDVVTWNVGGNDLNRARSSYKAGTCGGFDNQDCLRAAVTTFQAHWQRIITAIVSLRHGRPTVLRTMDIYNPYVAEDMATGDFGILNSYLTQVNNIIHATAGIAPYAKVAKVYEAFNLSNGSIVDPATKGLLSFDGFHPNTRGHAVIAAKLNELGHGATIP